MILSLFRKDPTAKAAAALFAANVEQARRPAFYEFFGVPDSVEGRFEMVALHVYLSLARMKAAPEARRTAEAFSRAFFANMDDSLREMNVGDLSVGKRVRRMGEALYGRIGAYDGAIAVEASPGALAQALARNVYESADAAIAAPLAAYVQAAAAALGAQPVGRLISGIIEFPDPNRFQEADA